MKEIRLVFACRTEAFNRRRRQHVGIVESFAEAPIVCIARRRFAASS
jgi:hypothetical protein